MRGRPKRLSNPTLCAAVEQRRVKLGLSLSETAALIGVHPSTLIRSLRTKSLSPDMMTAVQRFLNSPATSSSTDTDEAMREALLLLQKLNRMSPRLQAALEIVLNGVQVVK
ncbi:helix-turn-helix domain-containing protein [Rhizobium acidisoli]|uniref:helix-turn-helix domain-containing protein n=1 Tax=Rhizobium acidisoli TaxID=1538158 RepID=UPI003CCA4CE3